MTEREALTGWEQVRIIITSYPWGQWLYLTHPTLSGASWGFKGHGKAWAREGQAGEAIEAKLWSDGGQEKGIVPLGGIV